MTAGSNGFWWSAVHTGIVPLGSKIQSWTRITIFLQGAHRLFRRILQPWCVPCSLPSMHARAAAGSVMCLPVTHNVFLGRLIGAVKGDAMAPFFSSRSLVPPLSLSFSNSFLWEFSFCLHLRAGTECSTTEKKLLCLFLIQWPVAYVHLWLKFSQLGKSQTVSSYMMTLSIVWMLGGFTMKLVKLWLQSPTLIWVLPNPERSLINAHGHMSW